MLGKGGLGKVRDLRARASVGDEKEWAALRKKPRVL